MNLAQPKLLMSQREVAEALSVSPSTVANLRRSGRLPFVKIGKKSTRYPVDGVRAIAENLSVATR